jgi:hypothetical protein
VTNEQVCVVVVAAVGLFAISVVRDFRKYLDAKIDPIAARLDRLEKLVRGY